MANLSEETREQIRQAVRHPVVWWRGAELPEEKIRPWEGGIQLLAEGLKGFMSGFTGLKDKLFIGMGKGMIPPNWKSVHDVIRISWDAANDPVIGVTMDRKPLSEQVHRWIMRLNATLSPAFILIQCFRFGDMGPLQRLILWTAITMFADIMSTANAVSESKIWAGITPHTDQRGLLQTCKTVGGQLAEFVSGIPIALMGMKDILGWSDYQIMIYGALVFAPLTMFCRWLPSYAKQRVDFTVRVKGEEDAEEGQTERTPSLRESFAVVKHNRWFIIWTIIGLLKLLIPKTDYMNFYRFLVQPLRIGKKEIGGEVLYVLRGLIFASPSAFLQPFATRVAQWFGNKANFVRAHVVVSFVQYLATYFIGYNSWPKLIIIFTLEGIREIFDKWMPIPKGQIDFEMYDYVEWKTGLRSEGMTMAVSGMLNKLVKDNIGSVFENAVTQWTGFLGWEFPREQQPERFMKSIWPLRYLAPAIGEVVVFIALLFFKYDHDPKAVEADLIERRALAQRMRGEAEAGQENL
ncbi:MAG: MFS transporter [Firmicutes bacterium]|nr:MFS transporter [Bacillota bacterium]